MKSEVGGHVGKGRKKRKMPPFKPSYSSNEMLTVEGSDGSKCMKQEFVAFVATALSSVPALCELREQGPIMWNNQFCTKSVRGRRSCCCCTSFEYESPKKTYFIQSAAFHMYILFIYYSLKGKGAQRRRRDEKENDNDKEKGSGLPGAHL